MEIPKGVEIDLEPGWNETHALNISKYLCGQKQTLRQFDHYVSKMLTKMDFQKLNIDECMFFKQYIIFIIYLDERIIFIKAHQHLIRYSNNLKKEWKVEKKWNVPQFLGMKFTKNEKEIKTKQINLIDQIIKDMGLSEIQCKCSHIPMKSSHILQRNQHKAKHEET